MIKINLLIKPPPLVRWRVVLRIAALFGLAAIVGISASGALSGMRKLEREIAETKRLMADYQQVGSQLPDALERLAQVQGRRTVVEGLGRNQRFSQSAVLERVLVTPNGVRLVDLTAAGPDLVITGEATSFAGAMEYLAYLRSVPLIRSVSERSLRTIDSGATSFTFAARIREQEVKP
ncbi:MAG: PilN domain-containing protein [Bacillota bacterium]